MQVDGDFIASEEMQAKFLAIMLDDPSFASVVKPYLQAELFANRPLQWYYDFITKADSPPTHAIMLEQLMKAQASGQIRPEEGMKFGYLYDVIKAPPPPSEIIYIKENLTSFIRHQKLKRHVAEMGDFLKSEDWTGMLASMTDVVNAGVNIHDMGSKYFIDYEERIKNRLHRERHRRIMTGIPQLDEVTYGGIKNKQVAMIVGATGRGKSIFMTWLARQALIQGKKVAYITCELSEADIGDRFDSLIAQINISELNDYQKQILETLEVESKTYGDSLRIKYYPADTATVDTIKSYLLQLSQANWRPDLVIVDYLDLIKPHRTYSSQYLEVDAVTKALVGMAAELDVSVYTGTQMNRAGIVNESPDESAVAGYIGKLYHLDLVMNLAQTKEESLGNEMRIIITKNRNGRKDVEIKIDTNFACMQFYKERQEVEYVPEENTIQPSNDYEDDEFTQRLQLLFGKSNQDTPDFPVEP